MQQIFHNNCTSSRHISMLSSLNCLRKASVSLFLSLPQTFTIKIQGHTQTTDFSFVTVLVNGLCLITLNKLKPLLLMVNHPRQGINLSCLLKEHGRAAHNSFQSLFPISFHTVGMFFSQLNKSSVHPRLPISCVTRTTTCDMTFLAPWCRTCAFVVKSQFQLVCIIQMVKYNFHMDEIALLAQILANIWTMPLYLYICY